MKMIKEPFKECDKCPVKSVCTVYSGKKIPWNSSLCVAKVRLDVALQLSEIPKRFLEANLYMSKIDSGNKKIMNLMATLVEDLEDKVSKGWNYIFAETTSGIGKTHMACILLNHYIYKMCQTRKFDFETPLALFVDYADLIDELRYSEDRTSDRLDILKTVPLLLLDDLGAGKISDFAREQVFLIVNYRNRYELSTIITSNYKDTQFGDESVFGKRISTRLLNSQSYTLKDLGILQNRR
jgi:DNA replication protein DnaC